MTVFPEEPHSGPALDDLLRERARLDAEIEVRRPERCVAFIDMVGSTAFTARYGDIEGKMRVDAAASVILPIVKFRGGKLIKEMGDGWMVLFNDPNQAVQAAVEIQQRIRTMRSSQREPIQLKIGLDFGRILMESGDIYGDVVNKCSKLVDRCRGGAIYLTHRVRQALDPFYQFRCAPLEELKVRGTEASSSVFELLWDSDEIEPEAEARRTLVLDIHWDPSEIRIQVLSDDKGETALISFESKKLDQQTLSALTVKIQHLLSSSNFTGSPYEINRNLEMLGRELFKELFPGGIAQRIVQSQDDFLLLVLDPRCVHIPWELAHDGTDFLCCRFSLGRRARTPQATTGLRRRAPVHQLKILTLSNPTGDLAAATKETENLLKAYGDDQRVWFEHLNGHAISSESLKSRLSGFDIIHYSGHADFFPDEPDKSRWVLHNGFLTARDLEILTQEKRPGPLLVFSNACHSGATDAWSDRPIGWSYGLANAFLLAGATHYIGTIAELLDDGGRIFATAFYRRIIAGLPVGKAIQEARLEVRGSDGTSDLSWAQYVLYGDPGLGVFAKIRNRARMESGLEEEEQRPLEETTPVSPVSAFSSPQPPLKMAGNAPRTPLWLAAAAVILVLGAGIYAYLGRGLPEEVVQQALASAEESYRAQDYPGAMDKLEELQNSGGLAPSFKAHMFRLLGDVSLAQGDATTARQSYESATTADPQDPLAVSNLALLHHREDDLDTAVALMEKASRLSPEDPFINALWVKYRREAEYQDDQAHWALMVDLLEELEERVKEATAEREVDPWSSRPLGLALLEFDYPAAPPLRLGESEFLSQEIERALFGQERLVVVDRDLLEEILKELKVDSSSLVDSRYRSHLGRLLAARGLIQGSIDHRGNETIVNLEVVDTENRTRAAMATVATTKEISAVAEPLVQDIADQLTRKYPLQGRIVSTTEAAVLNLGELHGVREGAVFDVFWDNPQNPTTVTGFPPIATIRVVQVEKEDSAFEMVEGELRDLSPHMRVREVRSK
jgi:class 3 adenylate cyclase/CHAT domain-containing protein/tetratricopeptide (TPR) repeat protein